MRGPVSDYIPMDMTRPRPQERVILQPPAPPMPSTDTDDTDLWEELRGIIETGISHTPRSMQKEIGPSELGTSCPHCLAARLAGWTAKTGPDHGWTPMIGTSVHEHLQHLFDRVDGDTGTMPDGSARFLTELRVTVGRIQGVTGGTDVHGSIDLWDRRTRTTVDWKIVGDWSMSHKRTHGMPQQYEIQASLYGIGLENSGETVRHSMIACLPKTGRRGLADALIWRRPFDPLPGRWALRRAQTLAGILDLIELQDGPEARDAWITLLPCDTAECFHCRDHSYEPRDLQGDLWAANHENVIGRYRPFTQLIQPDYPTPDKENQ